ncbi:MAG: Rpn family recombination-promoting nuclease/putative transposase [Bacteroides sp.]
MRYLDPKADLTFKRVFGEHPDVVKSFLNAMLPFESGDEIQELEYVPVELVPDHPLRKNSIVDVRCRDNRGRQFIVEMQMIWSPEFKQRVLFNASKAYVRQIGSGEQYELLQPVYSLNLVNEVFEPDMADFYHYYRLVHVEHTEKVIEGLHLIFVELPKFSPQRYSDKKMQVLWLRFLTEINSRTREVPVEFMSHPEISKAVRAVEESSYTDAQLLGYEKFWDIISVEKTLYNSAERRGLAKGMKEGMAKGMEEGLAKGMEEGLAKGMEEGLVQGSREASLNIALKMKLSGLPIDMISSCTGLAEDEIRQLE